MCEFNGENVSGEDRREGGFSRREFLEFGVAATLAAGAAGAEKLAWADAKGDIPRRTLGRTGDLVSAIGLGG